MNPTFRKVVNYIGHEFDRVRVVLVLPTRGIDEVEVERIYKSKNLRWC